MIISFLQGSHNSVKYRHVLCVQEVPSPLIVLINSDKTQQGGWQLEQWDFPWLARSGGTTEGNRAVLQFSQIVTLWIYFTTSVI